MEGADNNGNVIRAAHYVPNGDTGAYWVGASNHNWYYHYDYDRWGNRTIDVANTTNLLGITRDTFTVSATTNRLTTQNGVNYGYDAAGNQTTFGAAGQPDYELRDYDAENRLTRVVKGGVTSYYLRR